MVTYPTAVGTCGLKEIAIRSESIQISKTKLISGEEFSVQSPLKPRQL